MTTTKLPVVAAVIPLHNHARWVNDAIDSVASQGYSPLRIIVVDDGSADGSSEAVMTALKDVRVGNTETEPWTAIGTHRSEAVHVMVSRFAKARGPSFARNYGMKVAGDDVELFALLDSDDTYGPGKIARSVEKYLQAPDEIGVVYSDYDTVDPQGVRRREYKEPFSRLRLLQECIINCDSVVSRKAIMKVGGFDEELRVVEDYDLWLRLTEHFMAAHIPDSLVSIRVGGHSSTSTVASATWQAAWKRVAAKTQARNSVRPAN